MRIVYRFPRSNSDFLDTLLKRVTTANATGLELHGLPAHVIETVLMSYKLTR